MIRKFYTLFLIAVLSNRIDSAKLPKDWKLCGHGTNTNKCLKGSIQDVLTKHIMNGNSKFGINPLDPLKFEQLVINQGSGPVSINLDFKNLNVEGLKNLQIDAVNADWDNYRIEGQLHLEGDGRMNVHGDYKINGKVLVLPISGFGKCKLLFEKLKIKVILLGEPLIKNGKKYVNIKDFKVELYPARLRLNFENLFNGDKALGDNMNRFLNENWAEIFREVSPGLSQSLAIAFRQISNKIFHKVPLSEITQES